MAVNGHAGSIAIQHFEPFSHISDSNSALTQPGGTLQKLHRSHANPIIFHFDVEMVFCDLAAQIDAATLDLRGEPVLNRILDQRLQQHARHHDIERCRIEFFHNPQFVAPETDHFNVEIVVDEVNLILQWNKSIAAVQ